MAERVVLLVLVLMGIVLLRLCLHLSSGSAHLPDGAYCFLRPRPRPRTSCNPGSGPPKSVVIVLLNRRMMCDLVD